MLYFDTSFLTPLILVEPTSSQIQRFFRRKRTDQLAISHWTRVEFSSVLARHVRMGSLTRQAALRADVQFETVADESFTVLSPPSADEFNLAKAYLQRYRTGLRAGDALHLAIASNHGARVIYTLDERMRRAGKTLQLPVRAGISLSR